MKTQMAITLIGMPGSGKTSVGKALAKALTYSFLDVDHLMLMQKGESVSDLLSKNGDEGLKKIEEETILSIHPHTKLVIATGGSAIYSELSMTWLKSFSLVIFLHDRPDRLRRRISNLDTRGIVGMANKTFEALYQERLPLYKKYADITLEVSPFNKTQIVAKLQNLIAHETE